MRRLLLITLLFFSLASYSQSKTVTVKVGGSGSSTYTPTITTASGSTTLTTTYETWVFTGSSDATFTLPSVSGNTAKRLTIKNRGAGDLTVQRAGSDNIYTNGTATSIVLLTGDSYTFQNDGTYWIIY